MKIGIMNNPSKSVYEEATFCGKAGFVFLDLTIEGPSAATIDISKLRPVLEGGELGKDIQHVHFSDNQSIHSFLISRTSLILAKNTSISSGSK
jgi:hypothetical protein